MNCPFLGKSEQCKPKFSELNRALKFCLGDFKQCPLFQKQRKALRVRKRNAG